jgi:hypothetical protein
MFYSIEEAKQRVQSPPDTRYLHPRPVMKAGGSQPRSKLTTLTSAELEPL